MGLDKRLRQQSEKYRMGGTTALCGTALIKYLNSTDIEEKVFSGTN